MLQRASRNPGALLNRTDTCARVTLLDQARDRGLEDLLAGLSASLFVAMSTRLRHGHGLHSWRLTNKESHGKSDRNSTIVLVRFGDGASHESQSSRRHRNNTFGLLRFVEGSIPMSVDVVKDGNVWTVVLDRPEFRNAVDTAHARALLDAFEAFDSDPDAAVAILWGKGGHFCA